MKVLVVDDDLNTAEMVKDSLSAYSHTVETATDGSEGSFLGKSYEYDAIVLDYNLPKKDGLTICKEIRQSGRQTPILFLSINDETDTKVAALKAGADDYITKPFSLEELNARLMAVTRRSPKLTNPVKEVGDLKLDDLTHSVSRAGTQINLTRKEFQMLEYFVKHVGSVVSRAQLMEHVWTADGNPFSNTVEAHIRNLRNKLTSTGGENMIINLPGRGYVFDTPENLKKFKS